ncbi:hypothetical protein [Brevundimonas sp. GCM10030266]|uniref:hypothetical protein n=1 Tax=Brevundimonas sp. GCM10030266 TaxID=3273386 RepID=UPI00360B5517
MNRLLPILLLSALLAAPATARPQDEHAGEHRLVLTGVGRFAIFADMVSLERDGDGVKMRAFQVTESDFEIAGQAYWGGWSWWRFDCAARTADRLDFAAVKAGGAEGPATPDPAPAYEAVEGGDAAELLTAACDPASVGPYGVSALSEAVWVGREALANP